MKKLILLTIVALLTNAVNAQQFPCRTRTQSDRVTCLAVSGSNLFAGLDYQGGVYLSSDNGSTWNAVNNGLWGPPSYNYYTKCLAVMGNNIFVGIDQGVFLSTNNGSSWTRTNHPGPPTAMVVDGPNVYFIGSGPGVFLTPDNFNTSINLSGSPQFSWYTSTCLAVSGNNILVGTDGGGMFLSSNNGSSWTAINTGLTNLHVAALAISGSNFIAATSGGVFVSNNNGSTWAITNPVIYVSCFATSGNNIVAGSGGAVYYSNNNGNTWAKRDTGITIFGINALAISGNNIFAEGYGSYMGNDTNAVFLSTDTGRHWINAAMPVPPIITSTTTTLCPSQSITLSVTNPCTGCTYSWYNSLGQTVATGQIVSISTAGTYRATATNICTSSYGSNYLTLRDVIAPTITILDSSCSGSAATLKAIYAYPIDVIGYLWSTGSTSQYISTALPSNYSVQVLFNAGCTSPPSLPLPLPVIINCGGRFILEPDSIINYFDTLNVQIKLVDADSAFSTFAKLHFDNNRMRLISSKAGDFLGTNINNLPPIVTGGVIDFGLTKTSGQPGSSGNGTIYSFSFTLTKLDTNVLFDAVNPKDTFTLFSLRNQTVYDVTGALRNVGMPRTDTTRLRYYVPVWPGDLNNDHNVNVADILPIGYFYNSNGPSRLNAGLQWIAQPAKLWAHDKTYTYSPAYRVFADGTGNGIVDLADQSAIGFNSGKTHALTIHNSYAAREGRSVFPPLSAEVTETQIDSTQFPYTLAVKIKVGSTSEQVDSVLGIAFDLLFDPECVDTNDITTAYTSAFGTLNTTYIKIEDFSGKRTGKLGIGITRYGVSSISLNGDEIVTVNFKLNNGCYDGWFNVIPRVLACNNDYGAPISLESEGDSVRIEKTNNQPNWIKDFSVNNITLYPNPATNQLFIEAANLPVEQINIYNTVGTLVSQTKQPLNNYIDISHLVTGVYIAEIKLEKGSMKRRWVKM